MTACLVRVCHQGAGYYLAGRRSVTRQQRRAKRLPPAQAHALRRELAALGWRGVAVVRLTRRAP